MFRLYSLITLLAISTTTYSFAQNDNQELSSIKADMEQLSKNTQPGSYYNDSKVPVEIGAFREDMLRIGNMARRDSEYRTKHGEKEATDFSNPTVTIGGKESKIYKNQETPPYFNDLVLNDNLNRAAQFQAEYLASKNSQSRQHYGPENYQGKSMLELGDRLKFFDYTYGVEGEGVASLWSATGSPETFMQGDTHFRPWFNIGADVVEIGLGVAQGAPGGWGPGTTGVWYTVVIAGLGANDQHD
jgi:hypothetical protein